MEGMDRCTCFVRNIAPSVTEEQVTELFGEVGPVKKAFIIGEKGSGSHKGYGFVTFALPADAQAAVSKLANHKLAGKRLQVEAAQKRKPLKDRHAVKSPAENEEAHDGEPDTVPARTTKPSRPHAISTELKAALNRAVAVGGFQEGQQAAVTKLVEGAGSCTSIEPLPEAISQFSKLAQDGCNGQALLVYYSCVKDAVSAVAKLHRQPVASAASKAALWARQVNGEGANAAFPPRLTASRLMHVAPLTTAEPLRPGCPTQCGAYYSPSLTDPSTARFLNPPCAVKQPGDRNSTIVKRWRIIIRNLPFGISEADLIDFLSPSGLVWTVSIPKFGSGKMKGFGFACFTCKAHAAHAIDAVNGKKLKGRVLVADWSLSKHEYGAGGAAADVAAAPAAAQSAEPAEGSAGKEAAASQGGDDAVSEGSGEGGAVEHGSEESERTEHAEGGGDGALEMRAEEKDMYRSVLGGLLGETRADAEAAAEGGGAGRAAAEAGKGAKRKRQEAAQSGAAKAEAGPAEWEGERAEEPDGKAQRGGSGVIDTQVFVRGLPVDVTSVELTARMSRFGDVKQCRLVMDKVTGKAKGTAFIQFMEAQAAQKACAACARHRDGGGEGVSMRGKTLNIDAALVQDSARALAQSKDGKDGRPAKGQDRRNLYLTQEGRIEAGSALWAQLSAGDQQKRQTAVKEVGLKLKSPNFVVSPTRLRVLNVPLTWDSKQLKTCCHKAVLTRATKAQPKVTQCIVLRDKEKVDAGGQPRSRGCAFVEFESTEHALVCLRQMNNNPNLFGSAQRRPIVEFAIESVKALKVQARRQRLVAERQEQRSLAEVAPEEEEQAGRAASKKTKKKSKKRRREEDGGAEQAAGGDGKAGGGKAGGGGGKGGGAEGDAPKTKVRKQQSTSVKPVVGGQATGSKKPKRETVPAIKPNKPNKADAAGGVAGGAVHQQRSVPRNKPVPEQPRGKRKKHKAANADDLDRVLSNRAATLFGSKSLQLDSKWFD